MDDRPPERPFPFIVYDDAAFYVSKVTGIEKGSVTTLIRMNNDSVLITREPIGRVLEDIRNHYGLEEQYQRAMNEWYSEQQPQPAMSPTGTPPTPSTTN
jgi:hypothetical protein